MTKKVELKVVSSAAFAKVINEIVDESNGTVTHLEAVQEFLAHNEEIEPETIASLMQRNLILVILQVFIQLQKDVQSHW